MPLGVIAEELGDVMWLRAENKDIDAAKLRYGGREHQRDGQEEKGVVRVHRHFAQGQRRPHGGVFSCAEEGEL